MLIIGDIQSALLHNSMPLPEEAVADLLSLRPGRPVSSVTRPINRTVSPGFLEGVDCPVATVPPRRTRVIGTVAVHAVVTGGTVVQSCARARVEPVADRQRRGWAYYAGRHGVLDLHGDPTVNQLVEGTRLPTPVAGTLDLASMTQRTLAVVQARPQLDHQVRLHTRPTSLRWVVEARETPRPRVWVYNAGDTLRFARVVVPPSLAAEAVVFCEDYALHDWLYTSLDDVVSQIMRDKAGGANPMRVISAAFDLLVRSWMPNVHVHRDLRCLWREIDQEEGLNGSWHRKVAWIRDEVSVRTIGLQSA